MKRIVFSGYLHDMYPEGIEVCGASPAECISLLASFPGFRPEDGVQHTVVLPQFQSRDSVFAKTEAEEIHMVPIVMAAGGGGLGQVVLGLVLVAVGTLASAYGMPTLGAFLVKAGWAMVLGGVVRMLMPAPESSDMKQEERSAYLPAGRNTTKVGTRIPLILGRRRVWGHFLAFNVTAANMSKASPPADLPDQSFSVTVDETYTAVYEQAGT